MSKADKLSFNLCPETCPKVDDLYLDTMNQIECFDEEFTPSQLKFINELVDKLVAGVKAHGTYKLRDQLTYACSEWLEYEEICDRHKSTIYQLEQDKIQLENEIADQKKTIDQLDEKIYELENP